MYSSSNAVVPVAPQQNCGTQPMTVYLRARSVMESLQDLRLEVVSLHDSVVLLVMPRIANTAAQVFLIACSADSFRTTTSTYFSKLGTADAAILQLSIATGTPAATIVYQADRVITKRNNSIHFGDVEELDAEVAVCAHLLSKYRSTIIKTMAWECWVLDNYAAIKTAFSERFKAVV